MTPLLRFCRRSFAPTRAVPVRLGAEPPKPDRAARAGFGLHPLETAEVLTKRRRLLLVRAGEDLEEAGALAIARLLRVEHVCIDARSWSPAEAARLAAGALLRAWRFDRLRTKSLPDQPCLTRIDVMVTDLAAARAAWAEQAPGVEGALLARDLVVEPANVLTPAAFAERLQALGARGIEVEILGPDRLAAEGFGGLLAVGRASANPPCLAVLRWPGGTGDTTRPLVFVGKGLCFDTGGICVKPAAGMWEMRADMAGAAACAGAILALALRHSPMPAIAVLALAENAIGADSYRPGDVLTLHGGTTVEVVDTDAEGRLVLADALHWAAATLDPVAIIDLATLTGSIVTALGHHQAGLFATHDGLAAEILHCGAEAGEPSWRMPLSEAYRDALSSDIADIRHCSEGRLQPDACHAALFLRGFVAETPWAHLDIGGVESHEHASDRFPAGPTGWGARLLDSLVRHYFEPPP